MLPFVCNQNSFFLQTVTEIYGYGGTCRKQDNKNNNNNKSPYTHTYERYFKNSWQIESEVLLGIKLFYFIKHTYEGLLKGL